MSPELHDMATRMSWGHVRRLFPYVPREDKEDMVQEAVVKVWRKCPEGTNPRLVSTVTRTGIIDAARVLFGREHSPIRQKAIATIVHLDALPEGGTQIQGTTEDFYPCMAEAIYEPVRPRERRILGLRVAGFSNPEIAEMEGTGQAAIARVVFNGRRKIEQSGVLEVA